MTGSWGRGTLHFLSDVRVTGRALYLSPRGDPLIIILLGWLPVSAGLQSYGPGLLEGPLKAEDSWLTLRVKFGPGRETVRLEPRDVQGLLAAVKLASADRVEIQR